MFGTGPKLIRPFERRLCSSCVCSVIRLCALWAFLSSSTRGENILIIGDSIDRYSLLSWCSVLARRVERQVRRGVQAIHSPSVDFSAVRVVTDRWAGKELPYHSEIDGAYACKLLYEPTVQEGEHLSRSAPLQPQLLHSLSFVHVFGSADTGPYMHGYNGDLYDTKNRIDRGVRLSTVRVAPPDKVILQFAQWDVSKLLGSDPARLYAQHKNTSDTIASFREQTIARLEQVKSLVGNNTRLGLRTTIWNRAAGKGQLLILYNQMLRNLAEELGIPLYDMDLDLWSTVDYNYHVVSEDQDYLYLFQDYAHPRHFYTALLAEKYFCFRYCAFVDCPSDTVVGPLRNSDKIPSTQNFSYKDLLSWKSGMNGNQMWFSQIMNAVNSRSVVLLASPKNASVALSSNAMSIKEYTRAIFAATVNSFYGWNHSTSIHQKGLTSYTSVTDFVCSGDWNFYLLRSTAKVVVEIPFVWDEFYSLIGGELFLIFDSSGNAIRHNL